MRPVIYRKTSGSDLNYILFFTIELQLSSLLKVSLTSFGKEKKKGEDVEVWKHSPTHLLPLFKLKSQSLVKEVNTEKLFLKLIFCFTPHTYLCVYSWTDCGLLEFGLEVNNGIKWGRCRVVSPIPSHHTSLPVYTWMLCLIQPFVRK